MPRQLYQYARYIANPSEPRRTEGIRGISALTLDFIEAQFPHQVDKPIGTTFTYKEFQEKYYSAAFQGLFNLNECKMNTLKSRFHYLFQEGYLVRTMVGWDHWEVYRGDQLVALMPSGQQVEPHLAKLLNHLPGGITDEELLTIQAKADAAGPTETPDDLLRRLGFIKEDDN